MTDVLSSTTAARSSAAASPSSGPAASPKELLLLAQAVYASGATQAAFEAFPTLFAQRLHPRYVPHPHVPPPPAPPALATPAACMQQYKALLDSLEPAPGIPNPSLSASTSTAELKRPYARTHLRLARKAYTERLVQVKEQLAAEEAPMRALLQEIEEIQSGAWDARLTDSYTLVNPSDNPDEARYVYDPAGIVAAKESALSAEDPGTKASHSQPSGADGAAAGPEGAPNGPAGASAQEASTPAPTTQGLADIPEEESEKSGTTAASGPSASSGRKGAQAAGAPAAAAGSSGKPVSASSSGGGTAAGKPVPSKPPATERRSSGRTSRHSISAMSDIAPPPPPPLSVITNSDASSSISATNQGSQLAPASTTAGDSATTAAAAAAADPSPTSAAMELDSSRDSQPPGSTSASVSTSAAPALASRRGRGGRRASMSTSRDNNSSSNNNDNKRKRTATPLEGQVQRGPSPALSDRSRSKRIKTEEPDSSSGTPGAEGERADAAVRRFRNSAPHLISQMHGSIHSTFFKDPVRAGDALNYFEIVKRPMDLKTLLQKVKAGQVTCTAEFKRDVALIFANAVMYNGTNHDVARDARAMWADVQALFSVLEQAEQRAT